MDSVSITGRNTQGVRLMRVAENAQVVGVALAEPEEDADENASAEPEDSAEDEASSAPARQEDPAEDL